MITELRLRKDRNRFHFYFGDSLELCITNEEWKNKFHVIYCPHEFVLQTRLTNILPIVSQCLTSDMPEAVLLTDVHPHLAKSEVEKMTLIKSIEETLCCPLTMIPTVYGVKLLDPVILGTSVCLQLHDFFCSRTSQTIKWNKSPVSYSVNIQLEVTPAMRKIFDSLVHLCFIEAGEPLYSSREKNAWRDTFLRCTEYFRNSPLTCYNIIQSFFNRHNWVQGATDSIIEQHLPASFQLAWRTLQQWMNGKEVVLYCTNDENMRQAILSVKEKVLEFSVVRFVLKSVGTQNRYRPGQPVDEDFLSNIHAVFNLNWNEPNDLVFSFLLAKDYGLDVTTKLFVLNLSSSSSKILYSVSLRSQSMQKKVVINPNSQRLAIHPPTSNPSIPEYTIRCQESEKEYKLDIFLRRIKIKSLKGKL